MSRTARRAPGVSRPWRRRRFLRSRYLFDCACELCGAPEDRLAAGAEPAADALEREVARLALGRPTERELVAMRLAVRCGRVADEVVDA